MRAYITGIHAEYIPSGTRFNKVLVTGLGRSGTSAVGSILHHLGYFTGIRADNYSKVTFENTQLRHLLLADSKTEELLELIDYLSTEHKLFAWKDPKLWGKSGKRLLERLDPSWLLIVVFRDPLASALRRARSDQIPFLEAMDICTASSSKLFKFCIQRKKPLLYVSYEHLKTQPVEMIESIRLYIENYRSDITSSEIANRMTEDKAAYRAEYDR